MSNFSFRKPTDSRMTTRIHAAGPVGYQAVEFLDLPPMGETSTQLRGPRTPESPQAHRAAPCAS